MKKILIILTAVALSLPLYAQKKVRFMASWTPQSQFAGYYVAKEMGFYKEEGLDVEIVDTSLISARFQFGALMRGEIEFYSKQLIPMIVARARGLKILDVLQISQNSSLVCISHSPISNLRELDGKKVTIVATSSFYDVAKVYFKTNGVNVHWYPSYQPNNLFLSGVADAVITYGYGEYYKLLYAMGRIPEENTIWFKDVYFNCPEDGLCVMEDYYENNKETVEKFKKATIRGWKYAAENRDFAIDVVMKYIGEHEGLLTDKFFQRRMLDKTIELQLNQKTGVADFQPIHKDYFDDLVNELIMMGFLDVDVNYEDLIR